MLASIIDVIVVLVLGFAIVFILGFTTSLIFPDPSLDNLFKIILEFVGYLFGAWYFIYYQARSGQTLGKKFLGIKVIKIDGTKPTIIDFVIRELFGKALSALVLYIGFLMIIWDKNRQGLHDKLAKTYVVKVVPPQLQQVPPTSSSLVTPQA